MQMAGSSISRSASNSALARLQDFPDIVVDTSNHFEDSGSDSSSDESYSISFGPRRRTLSRKDEEELRKAVRLALMPRPIVTQVNKPSTVPFPMSFTRSRPVERQVPGSRRMQTGRNTGAQFKGLNSGAGNDGWRRMERGSEWKWSEGGYVIVNA